ncbi:MAG: hypothetical protein DRJ51_04770 [Thermoprotei archaeon]|nr:MAG: hypothetical protein DRJ51_04770 [Thermoprotei archaeon]
MKVKVRILPYNIEAEAEEGENLADIIARSVSGFVLPCGGRGFCGLCKVKVIDGRLTNLTGNEKLHGIEPPFRLACQARVLSDVVVELEGVGRLRALASGIEPRIEYKYPLSSSKLISIDGRPHQPLDKWIIRKVDTKGVTFNALKKLSLLWEKGTFYSVIFEDKIVDFSEKPRELGLAIDVGTTKIAAYLVDLANGRTLWESYILNPQSVYGDDVITRITKVLENKENLSKMHRMTIRAIEGLCRDGCKAVGRSVEEVSCVVAVGNTVMMSIFLEVDPTPLGKYPFEPLISDSCEGYGSEFDFKALGDSWVYVPPSVSGYIGSDALGDILTARILSKGMRRTLIIDIGTNTEVALITDSDDILATSAPAGPALEGGYISSGVRAMEGAIYRVRITDYGKVLYSYYGDRPIGLSGSGLISLIAEMLRKGVINKYGRFMGEHRKENKFYVDPKRNIVVTQNDIREFQKAKAAISSAWKTLLKVAGLTPNDLTAVYVCGSFGSSLDVSDALEVGLLPPIHTNKVYVIGNAAGTGAKLILKSRKLKEEVERMAREIKVIRPAEGKEYMKFWVKNLVLQ